MKDMGDLGFLGCTISEYGLPGVSSTAYGKNLNKFKNKDILNLFLINYNNN
jgi:hypothetical protein